jgi:hypothetical protein
LVVVTSLRNNSNYFKSIIKSYEFESIGRYYFRQR